MDIGHKWRGHHIWIHVIKTFGRIINIGIDADIYIDKNYSYGDVMSEVIDVVKKFFDINKHRLGEKIYLSMLMKEISNVSGVLNLMDLRVFNHTGEGYSENTSIDPIVEDSVYGTTDKTEIDIDETSYILNCDVDSMFEIKNPEVDIRIRSMVG